MLRLRTKGIEARGIPLQTPAAASSRRVLTKKPQLLANGHRGRIPQPPSAV